MLKILKHPVFWGEGDGYIRFRDQFALSSRYKETVVPCAYQFKDYLRTVTLQFIRNRLNIRSSR